MSAENPVKEKKLPRIVQVGNPVLRTPAQEVDPAQITSPEIQSLIQTMIEVMREAPGVGLAAPQIGVGLQVIVLEDHDQLMSALSPEARIERGRMSFPLTVIINPRLTLLQKSSHSTQGPTFFEGCLSLTGYKASVERSHEVLVEGWNEKGERMKWQVSGWPARILQHEVDHVQGTLYIDRMNTRTFASLHEETLALKG